MVADKFMSFMGAGLSGGEPQVKGLVLVRDVVQLLAGLWGDEIAKGGQ